jgi:hypothetical protein
MVSSALNSATVGSAQSLSFSALTGTGRFPGEVASLGCRGSSLVAAHGEGVQRFAAEIPVLGDPLGGFALAGQLVALGGKPAERFAVDLPIAAHAHAAHVLGAASNDDLGTAGGDQPGADMHGHFAGAAFAVNRQAGDGHRPAGAQQRGTGDVGRLFAHLGDAAEDDVTHVGRSNPGTGDQGVENVGAEVIGAHAGQAALYLPTGVRTASTM